MRPLSSLLPNKSNTWTMCSLPLVSGVVARCAQSVHGSCFGCARCAQCAGMSLSPDGGFQRVFCEVCAHLQNVSDSVAELDAPRNPFDDSDELCADQEKQLRKGFQPGEQKRALAPNPGAFPSGGKSGDFSGGARGRPGADLAIWPNLAPRRLF